MSEPSLNVTTDRRARCLGTLTPPSDDHPVYLHILDSGETVLIRPRATETRRPERLADVEHAKGVVRDTAWTAAASPYEDWRTPVRTWIAAKIAADWAGQA